MKKPNSRRLYQLGASIKAPRAWGKGPLGKSSSLERSKAPQLKNNNGKRGEGL